MEVRLQKFISDCGLMSRRAAEKEIAAGKILVNGKRALVGQKVDTEKDKVVYDGKRVTNSSEKIYIALHKPRGYVTTMSDERGRKCVPELLSDLDGRVYPCGRLDMSSEGLLLMTNDGDFAERLMHPKNRVKKVYTVKVRGEVDERTLGVLRSPMELDGYTTVPALVSVIGKDEKGTLLEFTLFEGRNREIRKMCEKVGLTVARLKRIKVGSVELGRLPCGKWRYLTPREVESFDDFDMSDE